MSSILSRQHRLVHLSVNTRDLIEKRGDQVGAAPAARRFALKVPQPLARTATPSLQRMVYTYEVNFEELLMMRWTKTVLAGLLLVGLAAPASAETTTVKGELVTVMCY